MKQEEEYNQRVRLIRAKNLEAIADAIQDSKQNDRTPMLVTTTESQLTNA